MPSDPRQFLPLRPVEFLLLLALVEQDQYGYGLVKEIAERTGGVVQLAHGNLYRVIKRLVADGLVEPSVAPCPSSKTNAVSITRSRDSARA